jgi:hypothetical protein
MQIDALLSDFASKHWDRKPFERLVSLVTSGPAEAESFARRALTTLPEGGTFLDLTLSFVTQSAFEELIAIALKILSGTPTKSAESVIAYASLQFPELLHPHLTILFELQPNKGTYGTYWPWRDSGLLAEIDLLRRIDSSTSNDERFCAWRCLLETRHGTAVQNALERASKVQLNHPVQMYLHEVGIESSHTLLYQPTSRHLQFDQSVFTATRPVWNDRSFHPTWNLAGSYIECRFGGYAPADCSLCGGRLHHLVTLPAPSVNAASILLATCLSCLGWERPTLSYSHDPTGNPVPLDRGQVTPMFPTGPLREVTIRLTPTPDRWRWQDWGMSNGRENLNRVYGYPSWIQSAEYPNCQGCSKTMMFILQLDSDLPTEDGDEWDWGSGGICYGFFCNACQVSTFLWQCT